LSRRLVLRPEARTELKAAQEWYDGRVAGLGLHFARAVDAALTMIERHPEAFPKVHGETRQCVMPRFPFSVLYRLTDSELVLLAVHHQRRNPREWMGRRG
jgi:toxin ParE1/3/4